MRALKPLKVEDVYDRRNLGSGNGQRTTIFFDRDEKDFFCIIGGTKYRNKVAGDLKAQALELLARVGIREWRQVIELTVSDPMDDRYHHRPSEWMTAELEFRFERYELADLRDDEQPKDHYGRRFMLKRPFVGADGLRDWQQKSLEGRQDAGTEELAERRAEYVEETRIDREADNEVERVGIKDGDDVILPYADETWAALMAIRERVLKANEQLQALKRVDTALAVLAKLGPRLLAP